MSLSPALSVVIPCVNGLPCIAETLSALEAERRADLIEVVVANRCGEDVSKHLQENFPWVRLLEVEVNEGIPAMRVRGIQEASSEIIAILEDHSVVSPGWASEVIKAHQSNYQVVGGPISNGSYRGVVDWAAFLSEYSGAMPPLSSGEVEALPGSNVAYKRSVFKNIDSDKRHDYWEYFLHKDLKEAGVKFLCVPQLCVQHEIGFNFIHFLKQRFYYSRSFAAMRAEVFSPFKRIVYALLSPLLVPLAIVRTGRNVLLKRQCVWEFVQSLPALCVFSLSYAAGEAIGYLFGAGDSLARVQ